MGLFQSSVASSKALTLNPEASLPSSSGLAESVLLGRSSSEELDVTGVEADVYEPTSSLSPAYRQLLDVITCVIAGLSLDAIEELHRKTDLVPPAVCLLLFATERHLWFNLSELKEK